ncbi:MAG: S-methyl-5-thioribose-1-phosphate isomerase [Armatimonadota bacterium]|nr:S-methyl-5-thioribose-1-phosphate isomerase [Armatimonadota bacterium]
MHRTVDYVQGKVLLIDQTRLPHELVILELETPEEVADAIKTMKVRGAPAIGVAAALGIALAARSAPARDLQSASAEAEDPEEILRRVERAAHVLRNTRPTAVNLFWGIERMLKAARECARKKHDAAKIKEVLEQTARAMVEEDEQVCRKIGEHGAKLMPDYGHVLTHCNAGALACVAYGTALGVIRAAVEAGKRVHVYADETRPRLQGMKLTAFELVQDGIPVTVITDNMAGSLMRAGRIDCVVVGADRIAANGDVANKIGTYSVAVLAHHHGIPFYVAAPTSTIDFSLASGDEIPIEERPHDEVTHIDGKRICPVGADVINPSFDVTPASLVTAIITEKGIAYPPYKQSLRA